MSVTSKCHFLTLGSLMCGHLCAQWLLANISLEAVKSRWPAQGFTMRTNIKFTGPPQSQVWLVWLHLPHHVHCEHTSRPMFPLPTGHMCHILPGIRRVHMQALNSALFTATTRFPMPCFSACLSPLCDVCSIRGWAQLCWTWPLCQPL